MTEDELDLEMRRQIRRGAVVIIGCSLPLIALFVTFAVVDGPSVALFAGIAMFVVMALVGVDVIARSPRPRPVVADGVVEIGFGRLSGVGGTAFGVLLVVVTAVQLGEPGALEDRRAVWLLLGPPAGVLVAALSVMVLLAPGRVRVGPEAVESVRPRFWGGRARVAWDDVEAIGIPEEAHGAALRTLPVVVQGSVDEVKVGTTSVAPTVWVLIEWLEHYRQHPADRSELAGAAGVERLAAIEERLATRSRWPRWFPPPTP